MKIFYATLSMGLRIYLTISKKSLDRIVPSSAERLNHLEAISPNKNTLLSKP